jgi:hypothetical protein
MTADPTITPLGNSSMAPGSIMPTCSAGSIIERGTGDPPVTLPAATMLSALLTGHGSAFADHFFRLA